MRNGSFAFLLVGLLVGFVSVWYPMKSIAPDIVKPLPQFVRPGQPPPADPAVVRQLEEMVKSNPRNFEALRELGNIHFDQRKFDEAAEWYEKALEVRPDSIDVRTDHGVALFSAKRPDEAIAEFQKSLALNPTHPETLYDLGWALWQGRNDLDGALRAWNKLVETNPTFPRLADVKAQIQEVESLRRQQ
jgi:tetratricopeptide (TPR) repeat protein